MGQKQQQKINKSHYPLSFIHAFQQNQTAWLPNERSYGWLQSIIPFLCQYHLFSSCDTLSSMHSKMYYHSNHNEIKQNCHVSGICL